MIFSGDIKDQNSVFEATNGGDVVFDWEHGAATVLQLYKEALASSKQRTTI